MRKTKVISQDAIPKQRPAIDPEEREKQLIAIAVNKVEERMLNGEASSAEYVHYLKLATNKERLEREKLELEKELLQAKTEALKANKRADETYVEVMKALKIYSGQAKREDFDEDEY